MADLEQARRAVLARFRGRVNRLAALLPTTASSVEELALQAEQADRVSDKVRERRAGALRRREPQRRTG
jgi:hypothetical protein